MALKSLKRQKLNESIVEETLKYIEQQSYGAGDRLPPERFFCDQFQISRSSFREAMKRLESYGIIEIRPGSGMYLRAEKTILSELKKIKLHAASEKKAMLEMIDLREMMEQYAIEQIIKFKQTACLDKLRDILAVYELKREIGKIPRQEDFLFHRTLYEGSGNELLANLFVSLKEMEHLWADQVIDGITIPIFGRETEPLHRMIYEAMVNEDSKEAKRLMRLHFDMLRKDLEKIEEKVFT